VKNIASIVSEAAAHAVNLTERRAVELTARNRKQPGGQPQDQPAAHSFQGPRSFRGQPYLGAPAQQSQASQPGNPLPTTNPGLASNASSASTLPADGSQAGARVLNPNYSYTPVGEVFPPNHHLSGIRNAGPRGCNACGKNPSDHMFASCPADAPTKDNWRLRKVPAQ
jgi:hypothetical protein